MDDNKPDMLLEIVGETSKAIPEATLWEHNCRYNGVLMVGKGESCSWCGTYEDGTTDQYK